MRVPGREGDAAGRGERRDLHLLVSGNVVSTFGNAVYILAVTLLLKELTESALMLGLFQFLALAPAFLLSPIIGAVIDRVSRRRIVILSDVYRGLLMLLTALALTVPALRSPALILPAAFLAGVGNALFIPAAHALLPSLVSPSRLPGATGLRAAGSQLANLGGNAVGGTLFALFGAPFLFLINGVTFLLSAVQEMFIRQGRETPSRPAEESLMATAREGLRAVGSDRRVLFLVASQAGLFLVSPVLMLALPFIVIDELGLPEQTLGYVFALALAGGIGAFLLLRRRDGRGLAAEYRVALAYLLLGAGFLALSVNTSVAVMIPVALISGAAAATVYLSVTIHIQRHSPAELHGRFFALLEAASTFVAPISYLAAGALLEITGPQDRWQLFALVGLASLIWSVVLSKRGRNARESERQGELVQATMAAGGNGTSGRTHDIGRSTPAPPRGGAGPGVGGSDLAGSRLDR